MPEPGAEPKQKSNDPPKLSPEQEVKEMLQLVESDGDASVEWKALMSLYKQLESQKNRTPQQLNIMKMIHPALSKYGYHLYSS
jgi:hypothetical protein